MKYPYIVNKDGVWYEAGTEVPADTNASPITEEANKENNVEETVVEETIVKKSKRAKK